MSSFLKRNQRPSSKFLKCEDPKNSKQVHFKGSDRSSFFKRIWSRTSGSKHRKSTRLIIYFYKNTFTCLSKFCCLEISPKFRVIFFLFYKEMKSKIHGCLIFALKYADVEGCIIGTTCYFFSIVLFIYNPHLWFPLKFLLSMK